MNLSIKHINKETILLILFCLIGLILRFMWPEDMQWKEDQIIMWEHAKAIAEGNGIEWLGMRSGVTLRNPSLGLWIFSIFALFCDTPVDMVPIIAGFNVVTIFMFIYFAKTHILPKSKNAFGDNPEVWLWAVAITCVNPMAILFSRDIWATNILSFFTVLIMTGFNYRSQKAGAFFWGLFGAMIGQIHMPGFFFSFGFFVFALIYDRKNQINTNWLFWFLGSVLGTLPMIPWIVYAYEFYTAPKPAVPEAQSSFNFARHFSIKFYYYFAYDSIGVHLRYMMGGKAKEIWQGPVLFGKQTHLMGLCYVYLVGILLWKAKFLVIKFVEIMKKLFNKNLFQELTLIDQMLYGTTIGLGIVLTLTGIKIHPHYLACTYPLILFWPVKIFIKHKRILFGIVLCQLLISVSFFTYVHVNEGVKDQEYGDTYKSIMRDQKSHSN